MAKGGRSACGLLKRLFELFEGNAPEEETRRLKSEETMNRRYSISEARKRLPSLVREAAKGDAISLTRRGESVAVLVSTEKYSVLTKEKAELPNALEQWDYDLIELNIAEIYQDVCDLSRGRIPPPVAPEFV